ncbi:MAG: carbon storage regulator [Magnetococcales bacterium]|nr:carbon storage regulator [Magnetococcales bacterium]|tara:strand:+ start:228781 stop:229110 length:330 start_codon:yes stop_codon:yes gene_type:complete
MLLIARRESESVIINGSIEVKVIEIKGSRVKLGFEYPSGNTVYREEIFKKIQEENREAMKVDPEKLGDVLKKFGVGQSKSESKTDEKSGNKSDSKTETLTTTLTAETKE